MRFSYSTLLQDVQRMGRMSAPFLTNDAATILAALRSTLENLQRLAADQRRYLQIPEERPIRTRISTDYKRAGRAANPIAAALSFKWEVKNVATRRRSHSEFELVGIASTRIKIFEMSHVDVLSKGEWFYDHAHPPTLLGQWQVEAGDAGSPGCHFHFGLNQYDAEPPLPKWLEIPRLPSPLIWPMDVLDFLLGEIFQQEWDRHLAPDTPDKRAWGNLQEDRIAKVIDWQRRQLTEWSTSPWMALKKAKPPNDLFLE